MANLIPKTLPGAMDDEAAARHGLRRSSSSGVDAGPPVVHVVLTGFGRFAGIDANPTTELVAGIPVGYRGDVDLGHFKFTAGMEATRGHLRGTSSGGSGSGSGSVAPTSIAFSVVATAVLHVSTVGVVESLDKLRHAVFRNPERTPRPNDTIVWLHLGVAGDAKTVRLEEIAANEATFRVADEHGLTLTGTKIVESDEYQAQLKTDLPITALRTYMARKGHECQSSDDAGRFLCNYLYYHSLHRAKQDAVVKEHALFVHVPRFATLDREHQEAMLRDLLPAVAASAWLLDNPEPVAAAAAAAAPVQAFPSLVQDGKATDDQELFKSLMAVWTPPTRYKFVCVVNDGLGMTPGKIAAQCCHAVSHMMRTLGTSHSSVLGWESQGEPVIVVRGLDGDHLNLLRMVGEGMGLPITAIRDAGRTQVAAGSFTVLGVGPAPVEAIDELTGELKLL